MYQHIIFSSHNQNQIFHSISSPFFVVHKMPISLSADYGVTGITKSNDAFGIARLAGLFLEDGGGGRRVDGVGGSSDFVDGKMMGLLI
jgi:hypothetical protein